MKKNFLTKLLFFVFLIMIFNSNLVHAEEDIKIPENYIEKPENIENIENHLNTLIQVENGNAKVFNNEEAIEENDLLVFFDIEGKKYYIFNEQMINEIEYNNLCKLVHAEAENQDLKGKILIVNVVLNRVEDERFGGTSEAFLG